MSLGRKISLALMLILAFVTANAKIATWSIPPCYQELKRYYGDMYLFQDKGKWGIVKSGNIVILPAEYDFITPFNEGHSLAYNNENGRSLLKKIISSDGHVTNISDIFYLGNYKIFSEGMMPVANKSGKYGYINPFGEVKIKCQFDLARIFRNGIAPIKQGNYYKYIRANSNGSNIQYLITDENFHEGELTGATCFNNGNAAVRYNNDCILVGTNGKKIHKISVDQYKDFSKRNNSYRYEKEKGYEETEIYSVFTDENKSGLKKGDEIIVLPQFDSFPMQYNDGAIITVNNGKYGVLKISEGDIVITSSVKEVEVDRKGNLSTVSISYNTPSLASASKLFLDLGNGIYEDWTEKQSNNGGTNTIKVIPIIAKNAESCVIKGFVENDGIKLTKFEKSFSVNYPIKLRVSAPGPDVCRANEKYITSFSSTIFNDSNKDITVTATWNTGQSSTISIPAHRSKTVTGTLHVESRFYKVITLTLNTGERASYNILFEPYF